MAAKDKSNLSKFIGVPYIRKAGTNGGWYELASARGVTAVINTTNQTVDVVCDTRGSVFKGYIPEASVSLSFLENCDTQALKKLFGLSVTSSAGGSVTITDEQNIFDSDDMITLSHYSNDGSGVTSVVVKSSDGSTTYVADTDYTVTVKNNMTCIERIDGWAITAEATVLVSGTVNKWASEEVEITSEFTVKDEFEVMIYAEITNGSNTNHKIITMSPATLEADYNMEFLDVVKAGNIEGASLTFQLSEGGSLKFLDTHLSE